MKETNLLASVALFSELYNNNKYTNISDIIAEFIKGAIVAEDKWSVNSTELTSLLEKVYDFKLPESVIRTTTNSRLKGLFEKRDGYFHFDKSIADNYSHLNEEFNSISYIQNAIIEDLIIFIEGKENRTLSSNEREAIFQSFAKYLLDNGIAEKYSAYISTFIIKNQHNTSFTNNLNLVREGLILYQGIRFTADINELGKWKTTLKIYLSTEHLFNSLGYNGILFQEIFNDFFTLVSEINSSAKGGVKLIQLRYLEETKQEIDNFFQTAELIKQGHIALDPSKPAMVEILKGCSRVSDVKAKKVKFELGLAQRGIELEYFSSNIAKHPQYNVEDENTVTSLKEEYSKKGRNFDEGACYSFFRIFSKINYLRRGESRTSFERIGHIFLTENKFALYLAHNNKVKFGDDDIAFAKDIDYLINKFWFKLRKGFGEKHALPKSFDVITKAQLVLSAQISNSVAREFQSLVKRHKDGLLTNEEALELSYSLREKPSKPEDITADNVDSSLSFLNEDNFYENQVREKEKNEQVLKETQEKNKQLLKEIEQRDENERLKRVEEDRIKLNLQRETFVDSEWQKELKKLRSNLRYFFLITSAAAIPVIVGIFLKSNSYLDKWLNSLGNNKWWIWGSLALMILIEIIGRAYIFNKERVKSGWQFLLSCANSSKFTKLADEKKAELREDFDIKHAKKQHVEDDVQSLVTTV